LGKLRHAYKILARKTEDTTWVDNIKMNLKETRYESVEMSHRLVADN